MKQTLIQTIPQAVEDAVMGKMVFVRDGIEQIALGNYALDFKKSYAFLGLTQNKNKVILGDIHSFGAMDQSGKREIKYNKCYGKIEYSVKNKPNYVKGEDGKYTFTGNTQYGEWRIVTDGYRYSETILEVAL